ncbi:hypothetical protein RC74_12065 [Falsihalocynthiibacter arcticus]|uniref:Long-chain-fatty-acid--CoA ligase n=1 Tax=Falsihalocynthiibacter arcticus TaxID=1579316 RepID=A0A126V0Q1_9RHOB|nr:hypothetical protein RC74_12065 [Falsihalocynthiibacter arcticus]
MFNYGELCDVFWRGSRGDVIVCCENIENFARAMIALDGAVEAVCALNPDLPQGDIKVILSKRDFTCVVTDLPIASRKVFDDAGLVCLDVNDLKSETGNLDREAVSTAWLVPTSGTTSTPKLVLHSLVTLAHTALKSSEVVDDPQVLALFYDVTRFAGYQVFFQALLGGHTLVFPGLTGPMNARVSFCADAGVTHISATATLWRKILMCPASKNLPLQQITLGGEAADQPVLDALRKAFPDARITHIYASTEAGVGMSVSDGKAGFPFKFSEKTFNGVRISLRDSRLFICSNSAAHSYAGEGQIVNDEGWVDTGDIVLVEGGRFYIIGRESGVLNVGGDKVVPEQVRHVLLEHDLVSDAVVYGKKNPFTGTLVVADVKLLAGTDKESAKRDLEFFLKKKLSSAQRPRVLRFVDDIEVNQTGKVVHKK